MHFYSRPIQLSHYFRLSQTPSSDFPASSGPSVKKPRCGHVPTNLPFLCPRRSVPFWRGSWWSGSGMRFRERRGEQQEEEEEVRTALKKGWPIVPTHSARLGPHRPAANRARFGHLGQSWWNVTERWGLKRLQSCSRILYRNSMQVYGRETLLDGNFSIKTIQKCWTSSLFRLFLIQKSDILIHNKN